MPLASCVFSEITVPRSRFQSKKNLGDERYNWIVSARDGLTSYILYILSWIATTCLLLADPADCLSARQAEISFHPDEKQNTCVHVYVLSAC